MDYEEDDVLYVRELDPFTMINPCKASDYGGSKIMVIGKSGTGKSTLIKSLLWHKADILPTGVAMSGSESVNHAYAEYIPSSFIYDEYRPDQLQQLIFRQQKCAIPFLQNTAWAFIVLDDCCTDRTIFNVPLQESLFKVGRHWKLFYIIAMQTPMDIPAILRGNVDGVFILKNNNGPERKKIWQHYAQNIPEKIFYQLMDELTQDYHALYVTSQNDAKDWKETIFFWKPPVPPDDWKLGAHETWEHHNFRYNPGHISALTTSIPEYRKKR